PMCLIMQVIGKYSTMIKNFSLSWSSGITLNNCTSKAVTICFVRVYLSMRKVSKRRQIKM
ncbi:hypothetical protein KI387_044484, partial [Taxus chinensis]